ncbi:MAG: signal peptidase I [Oscillospiraceae bacterium]|nr:signal peptidase I [Oscillospiraceae bacterium]
MRAGGKNAAKVALTPEEVIRRRLRRLSNREDIGAFFGRLILLAVILYIILGVVYGITPVKNDDMSPKMSYGDLALYYRLERTVRIGDIVVFDDDDGRHIGRIVAQEGDSVEIDQERLMINGAVVYENDIFYATYPYEGAVTYPLELGQGEYFVLCDHRQLAYDSRYFGALEASQIKGKIITVIRRNEL